MIMNLALFDFDGTISNKDSVKSFFKLVCGDRWNFLFKYYLGCIDGILRHKAGMLTTQELKSLRVRRILKKIDERDFLHLENRFFEECIPAILKKSALEKIQWHHDEGDKICVVSASFDFCLRKWTNALGLNLITNKIDRSSGEFSEPDCNGDEKVRRVKENYDLTQFDLIYAYGDTEGDLPMLDIANKKHYKYFD